RARRSVAVMAGLHFPWWDTAEWGSVADLATVIVGTVAGLFAVREYRQRRKAESYAAARLVRTSLVTMRPDGYPREPPVYRIENLGHDPVVFVRYTAIESTIDPRFPVHGEQAWVYRGYENWLAPNDVVEWT